MTIKFYQSEAGNITVVEIGRHLLIKATHPGTFIVNNPSKTGPMVHEIQIPEGQTPQQVFEAINEHLKQVVG